MNARRFSLLLSTILLLGFAETSASEPAVDSNVSADVGRELFLRVWQPNDPRSPNGDGLGPMFNANSCAACHHKGAIGGAGPRSKNILLLTAFPESQPFFGRSSTQPQLSSLVSLHPAFAESRTVVIHHNGVPPEYAQLRQERLGFLGVHRGIFTTAFQDNNVERLDGFLLATSMRNATALFGDGLIEGISDEVIRAGAERTFSEDENQGGGFVGSKLGPDPFGSIMKGRVCELPNGKIGRFGWKAQMSSLDEFVLAACANELGLDVPGHAQPMALGNIQYCSPGYDMTQEECDALVRFVRELPRPVVDTSNTESVSADVAAGAKIFGDVGCARCHVPQLGKVEGIYSDLLLHDMGPGLAASGSYGTTLPNTSDQDGLSPQNPPLAKVENSAQPSSAETVVGARTFEWRTPPLWGVADSAPYLHDGRASTLFAAIRAHGGDAQHSLARFTNLTNQEQQQMLCFLRSLVAPRTQVASAE